MKFAWIDAEKANYDVKRLCRCLGVKRSSYYAWRKRGESAHAKADRRLAVDVRAEFAAGRGYYGSIRVHRELRKRGIHVSRKRVIRLMQQESLVARPKRRYRPYLLPEHEQAIAPNRLAQNFASPNVNERWVGDVTELTTASGKLYLAVVLDLCSRFIVGWALSAANDRHLAMRALDIAVRRRRPGTGLLHHTDQGSPYTSEDYQRVLTQHGITCSMSRRGNCYDNAVVESFFSTLKAELGSRFENHSIAKHEVFDYIEVFYNRQRSHSALGYLSPAEFERMRQTA